MTNQNVIMALITLNIKVVPINLNVSELLISTYQIKDD